MVDPSTAAASGLAKTVSSVVAKKLTSKSGTRPGGREERRQVYARFQAATMEAISYAEMLRMESKHSWPLMGARRMRELALMTHERRTELFAAYFELRLVANPAPLNAGEDAMTTAAEVLEGPAARKQQVFDAAATRAIEAQRLFTDACRDDLWYLPQWWQVHRRLARWLKGRKARRS
ncbi:hypothetical protein ACFY3G_02755 [Streptomyces phaeochromogenes]|uniref:hypothetical protein n=1 Tax=Streptomyces phaeochromogenes TaxID=1923 RepID=UPI0036BC5211